MPFTVYMRRGQQAKSSHRGLWPNWRMGVASLPRHPSAPTGTMPKQSGRSDGTLAIQSGLRVGASLPLSLVRPKAVPIPAVEVLNFYLGTSRAEVTPGLKPVRAVPHGSAACPQSRRRRTSARTVSGTLLPRLPWTTAWPSIICRTAWGRRILGSRGGTTDHDTSWRSRPATTSHGRSRRFWFSRSCAYRQACGILYDSVTAPLGRWGDKRKSVAFLAFLN